MRKLMHFLIAGLALFGCVSAFAESTTTIPVLMYHRVGSGEPAGITDMSFVLFTAELDLLQREGYKTVTMKQVADFMNKKIPLPPKTVAITFDDGWVDNMVAAKELSKRHMAATFYIITGAFGMTDYLTKEQVVELAKNSKFEIGAHTHTHFVSHADNLHTEVSTEMLVTEALLSKTILETVIKKPVTTLAWPYGYYTDAAIEQSAKLGFESTVLVSPTMDNAAGDSPLKTKRVTMDGRCSLDAFLTIVKTKKFQPCE